MSDSRQSIREPMFNAPMPVTVLVAVVVAAWGVTSFLLSDAAFQNLALSAEGLRRGQWHQLVTHIFLHGGIMHLAMNAIAIFSFGAPVVRLLGMRNRDIALFYVFFLVCGVIAGAGQVAVTWNSGGALIGASGAACGLWGAASRLLGRRGGLAPFFDRQVIGQAVGFAIVNVIFGLFGPFLVGVAIGWQAHIFGYLAGLLLIGGFGRLAGRLR